MSKNITIAVLFSLGLLLIWETSKAQDCSPQGNVAIFSNYDGGELVIDVNQDIPDLKIGIASYEPTEVTFTGAFIGNITEIIYAGYQPTQPGNNNCGTVELASVDAPPGAIVEILDYPPVTLISPDVEIFPGFFDSAGDNFGITGCSTCSNDTYQGGSNTAEQVIDFFLTEFGGDLLFLKTRYACWCGTQDLNQPASCCFELTDEENVFIQASPETTLCSGPVTLDAGPGFETYDWSTGETSQTIVVEQPGDYQVTVTSECGQASDQILIEPCDEDLQVFLEDLIVCNGEDVEIVAEVLGGVEPLNFEWNPDYGIGPGPFIVQFDQDQTIEVIVTDANGITATAAASISVVENPEVDLGPDLELCEDEITLAVSDDGIDQISWSTGDTGPTIQVTAPGTYSVSLENACGTAFDEIVIEECPEELTLNLEGGTVCLGESFELLADVSGGVPPLSFDWTPDLGNSPGPFSVSPSSSTVYSLTITDGEGNTASAEAEIAVVSEDLMIDLGTNQELCDGTVTLNAENPNAISYNWSTGETDPEITVDEPGVYSVTLTGECGTFTDQITIVECNALLIQLDDQTVCEGSTVTISAAVTGGSPPYSYAWIPPLGEGPGPFEVIAEFDQSYTLVVTDDEGNTSQESTTVSVLPSVAEVGLPDSVTICPGETVPLNAETEGVLTYTWSTGSTEPSINASIAGVYTVNLASPCTTFSVDVRVELLPENPNLPINRRFLTCESNLPLEIGLPEDEFYTLIWSTGEVSDEITIPSAGEYRANYASVCRDTLLTWNVETEDCDCEIYVPNAFTPDFNGINDSFKPSVNCPINRYEFIIWNRWGKPVFESTNPNDAWRGEGIEDDYFGGITVYFWTLEVDQDLKSIVPETIKRNGTISLIR